jgi:hypothetical protein
MVSVGSKLLAYFFIGIALYLVAFFLAAGFRVLYPDIEFITVSGRNIDIVNYLILGTFDLILFAIQIVLSIVFIVIVWVWNDLFIDKFLYGIGNMFNLNFLLVIQKVPESNVALVVRGIESLRLFFVGFTGDFFGDVSDGISDLFGGLF